MHGHCVTSFLYGRVCVWCPAGGEGYRVTAQMVLVCCWRSMKEVATLLGQLCHSLPLHCTEEHSHTQQGLITRAQVSVGPSHQHQAPGPLSTGFHQNQVLVLVLYHHNLLMVQCQNTEKTLSQFRVAHII